MDGLHLVLPPIDSLKVDMLTMQIFPPPDATYSLKSVATRKFPPPNLQPQVRYRTVANKMTKLNEFSVDASCQSYSTPSFPSAVILKGTDGSSADRITNSSKEGWLSHRNTQKKQRKKGKQNISPSCGNGRVQPALSKDYNLGYSNMDNGDSSVPYVNSKEVSYSDDSVKVIDIVNNSDGVGDCSESPEGRSCIERMGLSEAMLHTVVQKLSEESTVVNPENASQPESVSDGRMEEAYCSESNCYNDMGLVTCQVFDSVSVGSANYDVKGCDSGITDTSLSESPGLESRKGHPPNRKSAKGLVNLYPHEMIKKHDSQGFGGRRGKQRSIVQRCSSVHKFGGPGGSFGCKRKENSNGWQRVQRNYVAKGNSELKKASVVCPETDASLRGSDLLKQQFIAAEVNAISPTKDMKKSKDKACRKFKRKTSQVPKEDFQNCWRRSSLQCHAHGKIMRQNEPLATSASVNNKKGSYNATQTYTQIGSPGTGFQITRADGMDSGSGQIFQVGSESVCTAFSGMSCRAKETCDISLTKPFTSLEKWDLLERRSPIYHPRLHLIKFAQAEMLTSHAENSNHNHSSDNVVQRWVAIGTKGHDFTSFSRSACSLIDHSDMGEKEAPNSQRLTSSLDGGAMCAGLSTRNFNCSQESKQKISKLRSPNVCIPEDNHKHVLANNSTGACKGQDVSLRLTYFNEIARAVNEACRAQLASETAQVAIGGPIAEFERLLHLSSPVIGSSNNLYSCEICSRDQVATFLCRHETPSISLRCLWQWYEKHGSYGLEVRAEDYENPRRLGIDRFAFRAYFVPYLSAVQLFRDCGTTHSMNSKNGISVARISKPANTDNEAGNSSWSGAKESSLLQSVETTWSSNLELLFEYFESEQPQQRRPLYEKIQELVRGSGTSRGKMYGDPTNLNSTDVHDLHPCSWYSVAWYPIYRIPDGHLRTAFLTFHSLGHLVHRTTRGDCSSMSAHIVSPVVGLRSYKPQGESWFQLRKSGLGKRGQIQGIDTCGILKERLRTLEATASLMARAVINKGSQASTNTHPDYEFFLSRRR